MQNIRNYIPILACALLMWASCQKEESEGTKAVFSYVADGFIVNFTNFSSNASSYHWDFGDGDTAATRSPQHIYHAKGDFLVTLTATLGGTESSFTDTVVVLGPNIKIDGDFGDWENVPYAAVNEGGVGGNILGVKTFASPDFLNFYLEGTADFNLAVMDMYIDADNNPQTGYVTWMYPAASGADFLIEGNYDPTNPLASAGSIFQHNAPDNGWSWQEIASFGEGLSFSAMKTQGGKKMLEFSLKKSLLGTTRDYVNFALVEMDAGWAPVGSIPLSEQDTSKFLPLQL